MEKNNLERVMKQFRDCKQIIQWMKYVYTKEVKK